MKILRGCVLVAIAFGLLASVGVAGAQSYRGTEKDREAIQKTGEAIRAAFARGDVDGIMMYHHPDVIKALTTGPYQIGGEAVRAGLVGTLEAFSLSFTTSHVDNTFFQGDTAVEESTFAITGTPKHGGAPFVFKGRSMVVYVRYEKSPSGWASIREIIQPAP
jgi:ketosteroid isomerase-like protein